MGDDAALEAVLEGSSFRRAIDLYRRAVAAFRSEQPPQCECGRGEGYWPFYWEGKLALLELFEENEQPEDGLTDKIGRAVKLLLPLGDG